MKIKNLIDIVRHYAESIDCAFYYGNAANANAIVRSYPAVWLRRFERAQIAGRNDGYVVYDINLVFANPDIMHGDKSQIAESLENNAFELAALLALDDDVADVCDLSVALGTVDSVHDIKALDMRCKVKMYFNA